MIRGGHSPYVCMRTDYSIITQYYSVGITYCVHRLTYCIEYVQYSVDGYVLLESYKFHVQTVETRMEVPELPFRAPLNERKYVSASGDFANQVMKGTCFVLIEAQRRLQCTDSMFCIDDYRIPYS